MIAVFGKNASAIVLAVQSVLLGQSDTVDISVFLFKIAWQPLYAFFLRYLHTYLV